MLKYILNFLGLLKIYLYKGNEMYNDKVVGSPRKILAISKHQGIANSPLGFWYIGMNLPRGHKHVLNAIFLKDGFYGNVMGRAIDLSRCYWTCDFFFRESISETNNVNT